MLNKIIKFIDNDFEDMAIRREANKQKASFLFLYEVILIMSLLIFERTLNLLLILIIIFLLMLYAYARFFNRDLERRAMYLDMFTQQEEWLLSELAKKLKTSEKSIIAELTKFEDCGYLPTVTYSNDRSKITINRNRLREYLK